VHAPASCVIWYFKNKVQEVTFKLTRAALGAQSVSTLFGTKSCIPRVLFHQCQLLPGGRSGQ
jgi:hypothetical protein